MQVKPRASNKIICHQQYFGIHLQAVEVNYKESWSWKDVFREKL
jgi:hypothetical protein